LIYLDEKVHKQLRLMAVERDTSMTELVRQAIAEFLEKQRKRPRRP
jgi:predicted transcriptional regulator